MSDWVDLSSDAAQPPPQPQPAARPASPLAGASPTQPETLTTTAAAAAAAAADPIAFLVSRGMDPSDAAAVVGVCGAASLEDLKLVDSSMAAQAAAEAGLKMIPTRKWANAVTELGADGGEGPGAASTADPRVDPAADAGGSAGAGASADDACVPEPPFVQGLFGLASPPYGFHHLRPPPPTASSTMPPSTTSTTCRVRCDCH